MATKRGGQYALEITPEVKNMPKFYKDISNMAKKSKKIMDKTFSMKNMVMGGAVAGMIGAGLNQAKNQVLTAAGAIERATGRAEQVDILSGVMDMGKYRTQQLVSTASAYGVDENTLNNAFLTFSDKVNKGEIAKGSGSMSDQFVNFLSGIMDMKNGDEKNALMSSLFNIKKGQKFQDFLTTSKEDVIATRKRLFKGETEADYLKRQEKLSEAEQKIAEGKVKQSLEEDRKVGNTSSADVVKAGLFEGDQLAKDLTLALNNLNSNIQGAELMEASMNKITEGVNLAVKQLVKIADILKTVNIFSGNRK